MDNSQENTESESNTTDDVGQIRDILFGSQVRDYDFDPRFSLGAQMREFEQRFNRLEERLLNESEAVRTETKTRLDALESYVKHEVYNLNSQIETEHDKRVEDNRLLTEDIHKCNRNIDSRVIQIQEKLTKGQSDAREALLDQSKALLAEVHQLRSALTEKMERSRDKLEFDKTDRKALANMFNELAMRLNSEFKMPNDIK